MAVTNNLYPGIVDTYMPAFLIKDNSSDIKPVIDKPYTVISYTAQNAYEAAVDQYINHSDIVGVQALWDEYEIKLAEIDPFDPEAAQKKQDLEDEYKRYLKVLIQGDKDEQKIEDTFFAEKPEPIVEERTKTFNSTSTTNKKYICRVYFALSPYNKIDEVVNAQVTVRSQLTNRTVLHPDKYPCEIMLKKIIQDDTRITDDKYYIEIKPEDLKNCNFIIDQYYKVQLRFTSTDADDSGINLEDPDAIQAIDGWLSNNSQYFSEWSSICLIRGISEPTIKLQVFDEGSTTDIFDTIVNTQVIGELTFADPNETETLKYYNVKAYDDDNNLLTESGDIYANDFTSTNNFNYTLKYWFKSKNTYHFTLTYVTQNLYTETHEYQFYVQPSGVPDLNIQVTAYKDEENGRIGMRITRSSARGKYTGQLIIRRASSKDNFAIWEDICIKKYNQAPYMDFTWWDYTIESGIFYLYGIQGVDTAGNRTPMSTFKAPVMCIFDHIFLTGEDKQLKIEFNPSISSFKRVITESKVDTIGSQYPFIKRNGYVNYAQFPLGGLIASAMDEDGIFTTKEEEYNSAFDYYAQYNEDNDIKDYQDIIWEKFFRNKVSNFLRADRVRLFRSPTEGNFLVRIMDVNFQPNQTLGRRLWSFTSNLYEIDDCTIDNFAKYGIVTIEDPDIVMNSGEDEPATLSPIRRIVFIDNLNEFPTEGKEHVLYIYNKQLYIWDIVNLQYILISVPRWNEESPDLSKLVGNNKQLYTDGKNLYQWNGEQEEYDLISVPIMED